MDWHWIVADCVMSGEDVMGWDDGTIWKIEEVVVKIAARLLPNQTLPDLHMSVGLWETVLANSLTNAIQRGCNNSARSLAVKHLL